MTSYQCLISNNMSISNRLVVIATRKIFSYLLSLWPNFDRPPPPLTPGNFSQNLIVSSLGYMEGSHENWSWLVKYLLRYFVTGTYTVRYTEKHKQERPLGQRKIPPPTNYLLWHWDQGGNKPLANICIPYRSATTPWLWLWPFKVQVKFDSAIGLPIYGFLIMFNSNTGPN